jgi:hypothetical protein
MSLTKADLLELSATIYEKMCEGKTEAEVMAECSVDEEAFRRARRIMLDFRADEARNKPREHHYVEYCIAQQQNILDLNKFIKELDSKSQYNAVVGAIRLRSDIVDKMIARGMEFGVIRREPERRELIAGLVVADMTSDSLKKAILGQISRMNDMIARFGDGDIKSLDIGALHYGDPIETTAEELAHELPAKAEGAARARTSKHASGRRRVRED